MSVARLLSCRLLSQHAFPPLFVSVATESSELSFVTETFVVHHAAYAEMISYVSISAVLLLLSYRTSSVSALADEKRLDLRVDESSHSPSLSVPGTVFVLASGLVI